MKQKPYIINSPESKAIVEDIIAHLKKGEEVKVTGLGKFLVKEVAAREGRNPKTGEAINIPAHTKVKARLSSVLQNAI